MDPPHAACAHYMPAGIAHWPIGVGALRPGRNQHLSGIAHAMCHHLLSVVLKAVVDLDPSYAKLVRMFDPA